MLTDNPPWKRSPPDLGPKMEEAEGKAGVTRPVARRFTPSSQSPRKAESAPGVPAFSTVPSDTLSNPAKHQRKSAWARYESPAAPSPAHHKGITPPPGNNAIVAARQLWEQHAAAESDATDSQTPQPESPPAARSIPQSSAGFPVWPHVSGPFSMQDVYRNTLQAALSHHMNEAAMASGSSDPHRTASMPGSGFLAPAPSTGAEHPQRPERANPANGSLSILPEASSHPAAVPQGLPGVYGPARMAHIAHLSQQLEELLRGQSFAQQPSAQLPILASEPPIYGGGASIPLTLPSGPHPGFARFASQELLREHYSGAMDMESFRSEANAARAERRWNSVGSIASENTQGPNNSSAQHQLATQLVSNMSAGDSQNLLHSIHLLCQANEMAALANSRIKAYSLAANANLEGLAAGGMRKRKLPEFLYEGPKRHNSAISDAETYSFSHGHAQQMCAECGTTNTPTWRRSGKRLMCNACGLRRSRSIRSARSNSMPGTGASHDTPDVKPGL